MAKMKLSKVHKMLTPADYEISTWLLLGACFQCLLSTIFPRNVALLPPIFALTYRFIKSYLIAKGQLPNPIQEGVNHGRTTTQIPAADGTLTAPNPSESIVVLVLAASFSHPNGRFCPGGDIIGPYFVKMWADAEKNREKYGYLGNTPALVAQNDNGLGIYGRREGDDKGRTQVYLSYWKTLEGLQAFAKGDAHMKGWMWWDRGASEEFKHIGVMHETYEVPAGQWENISHNFRPFGIGHAQFPVKGEEGTQWISGLKSASGREYKSLAARMGKV